MVDVKPIGEWTDAELAPWNVEARGFPDRAAFAREVLRLRTSLDLEVGQLVRANRLIQDRAEAAEAALADARAVVVYERRANEENCAKLLEAEAELRTSRQKHADVRCQILAEWGFDKDELARCRPVVAAALAWVDLEYAARRDRDIERVVDAYRAGEGQ